MKKGDSSIRRERAPVRIADWVLYPDLGLLRKRKEEKRLHPKALHVLLVLIDSGSQGVSRHSLLDEVWGETYPSDYVVSRAIADLRSALGEKAGEQKYIRTLPKFGYQLTADSAPFVKPTKKPRFITGILTAVFAILISLFILTWTKQNTPTQWAEPRPLSAAPGLEHLPRVSPDGKWVIYSAMGADKQDWNLLRVAIDHGEVFQIAASSEQLEYGAAFSPDGEKVAYVRMDAKACDVVIQLVSLGAAAAIAQCTGKFPTLVDWSRDGQWIAYTTAATHDNDGLRQIYLVNTRTGEKRPASQNVTSTGTDFYPRFSPDGRYLAFLRGEPHPDHRSSLWIIDLESDSEQALTQAPQILGGMTWMDEELLLFTQSEGGRMLGQQVNLDKEQTEWPMLNDKIHPDFDVQHRKLAATQVKRDRDLVILEPDGELRAVAPSTQDDRSGQFSPDGQWLAFISRRSGSEELWIASTHDAAVRQLTRFGNASVRYPSWHPNGSSIMFTAQSQERDGLFQVEVVSGQLSSVDLPYDQVSYPAVIPTDQDGNNTERLIFACEKNTQLGVCIQTATDVRVVADAFFRPQVVGPDQWMAVDSDGALFRFDLKQNSPQAVGINLPARGRFSWRVHDNELFYSTFGDGGSPQRIIRHNLINGEAKVLIELQIPLADGSLSINPVTGSVLFARYQASSDDLVIIESQ